MKIFYRISDKSYCKDKIPGADKIFCLNNFISIFPKQDILVIADNCKEETLKNIDKLKLNYICTSLGNCKSFIKSLCLSLDNNDIIYFVEDDYLHKPNSYDLILEGVQFGDYVTLYDHPDKYLAPYNYGETCKVHKGSLSHWRTTISSCMTFAAKSEILKEDKLIWDYWCSESFPHPQDHNAFQQLNEKGRKLVVSIPGNACHMDMAFSLAYQKLCIEPWAIELALKPIKEKIIACGGQEILSEIDQTDPWEYIIKIYGLYGILSKMDSGYNSTSTLCLPC